jgi:7,8-dihydropterin-6-yl-methyl-4-(beta-D-ribofuranosyl)aminobenzene 5'-phosphate synthase
MPAFKLTIVAEDTAGLRGTLGEHGLSVLVESDGRVVLFDTGQGLALRHNAEALELALWHVEAVAISHGHYDHTGGLTDVLELAPNASIFLHPDALGPKYAASDDGVAREIGVPAWPETGMKRASISKEAREVCPGVWTTGEIGRVTDFEDTGGRFYRDAACTIPDPLWDDQALFFKTSKGLVVVLGCAHAGVINTLEHIRRQSGEKTIHAVLGGMHLLHASEARIQSTLSALKGFKLNLLCPCHCTGAVAINALRNSFGDRLVECKTGSRFAFE